MIPFVVQASGFKQAAAATSIASNSITITAGDTVIVFVEMDLGTGVNTFTVACADGLSNTYTQVGSTLLFNSNNKGLLVFLATNCAAGACVVTATVTGGSPRLAIGTAELAGTYLAESIAADSGSPVTNTGTSTAPAAGSTTVTNGNQLAICVASSVASGTITATTPTGFISLGSILTGTSNPVLYAAYQLAAAGTVNPAWTIVSANWAAVNIVLLSQNMPTLTFNSSTGSDTTASGSGGTAKNGTAAATHSNQTVNITDAVDLSAFPKDGSAVLWIQSPTSGRQFSRIINITGSSGAWVVTTQDSYANTETKSWAIGGKRATLDNAGSRVVLTNADWRSGWTVSLDDTTAASLTSALAMATTAGIGDLVNGAVTLMGTTEGIVLNQTANANTFSTVVAGYLKVKNLVFTNSNVTKTNAVALTVTAATDLIFDRCCLGDPNNTNNLSKGIAHTGIVVLSMEFNDCAGMNLTNFFISSVNQVGHFYGDGLWINGCSGAAIVLYGSSNITLWRCAITNGSSDGLQYQGTASTSGAAVIDVQECAIDSNSGAGLNFISAFSLASRSGANWNVTILGNQITNNGTGLQTPASWVMWADFIDFNNVWNNTTNYVGISAGPNDTSVNPGYVSVSGKNWGITANKAKGFPSASRNIGANQSATVNYSDQGAAQSPNPSPNRVIQVMDSMSL